MEYVLIPLLLVVVGVLGWTAWAARAGRDPVSSVDRFNRALTAMQPADVAAREPSERPEHAGS